jgi:FKBP-type peptidyl-prolyl cis-trans isomerase FkpA
MEAPASYQRRSINLEYEKIYRICPCVFGISNNLNLTEHSSGIFYEIIAPGTGDAPGPNSVIFVRYTARFLNGNIFEQQTDHTLTGWPLNALIAGWQHGVPLIARGGKIRMVVPSSLAYGCGGYPDAIPGNTVLDFEIELVDFQ